jgi:hypothetical protein
MEPNCSIFKSLEQPLEFGARGGEPVSIRTLYILEFGLYTQFGARGGDALMVRPNRKAPPGREA